MSKVKSPRTPQRPRLERNSRSEISACIHDGVNWPIDVCAVNTAGFRSSSHYSLKDAKRLHAFLGKAITYYEAYLSQRRGRE